MGEMTVYALFFCQTHDCSIPALIIAFMIIAGVTIWWTRCRKKGREAFDKICEVK